MKDRTRTQTFPLALVLLDLPCLCLAGHRVLADKKFKGRQFGEEGVSCIVAGKRVGVLGLVHDWHNRRMCKRSIGMKLFENLRHGSLIVVYPFENDMVCKKTSIQIL